VPLTKSDFLARRSNFMGLNLKVLVAAQGRVSPNSYLVFIRLLLPLSTADLISVEQNISVS
jgi:hypothetical protein